jgi:hypothetical protein
VALLEASSAIVEALARERPAFTTDDVWAVLAQDTAGGADARTIANAFIRAERTGLIRNSRVGAYLRGTQAHRRWLTVWLSTALAASPEDAAVYAATAYGRQIADRAVTERFPVIGDAGGSEAIFGPQPFGRTMLPRPSVFDGPERATPSRGGDGSACRRSTACRPQDPPE